MKGDVKVLFFNGITQRSSVDVRIAGRVSLFQESASSVIRPSSDVFSEAAISLAVSAAGRVLETALGGEEWQRISRVPDFADLLPVERCRWIAQRIGDIVKEIMGERAVPRRIPRTDQRLTFPSTRPGPVVFLA